MAVVVQLHTKRPTKKVLDMHIWHHTKLKMPPAGELVHTVVMDEYEIHSERPMVYGLGGTKSWWFPCGERTTIFPPTCWRSL